MEKFSIKDNRHFNVSACVRPPAPIRPLPPIRPLHRSRHPLANFHC